MTSIFASFDHSSSDSFVIFGASSERSKSRQSITDRPARGSSTDAIAEPTSAMGMGMTRAGVPARRRFTHSKKEHETNSSLHQDQMAKQSTTEVESISSSSWNGGNFPYGVDYNDHFETPEIAYRDVQPLLDYCFQLIFKDKETSKKQPVLYDPYYCNGQAKRALNALGYDSVVHEKRDFYADMDHPPEYDIFISNPPYSDEHKIKCLDYCRQSNQPFFLLMPAYVATKQYFQTILSEVIFLIPSIEYQYKHPEQTGKDRSPFASLWFCGVGANRRNECLETFRNANVVGTIQELADRRIITLQNRPNPRQRRKLRQGATKSKSLQDSPAQQQQQQQETTAKKKKSSKYRDSDGTRKRRRF